MLPDYRDDLPVAKRAQITFDVPVGLWERARFRAAAEGSTLTKLYFRAVEAQLASWVEGEVDCVDPTSGESWMKPAGEVFPPRTGMFLASTAPLKRGEVMRVTLRLDPALLESWQAAVWQQLHTYVYPAVAFERALEAYLDM